MREVTSNHLDAIHELSLDETTAPPKDADILAAVNAVFFDEADHMTLNPSTALEFEDAYENSVVSSSNSPDTQGSTNTSIAVDTHGSFCDIQLDPLTVEHQSVQEVPLPATITNGRSVPTTNTKRARKKPVRSKQDLDRCLEERKLRRKAERLIERQNGNGRKVKKNLRLLKEPQKCPDCGKTFHYTGYLEAHLRYCFFPSLMKQTPN